MAGASPRAGGTPRDEDDVAGNVPMFLVRPSDNVYSFFMFIGPTDSKKKLGPNTGWDIILSYILVSMNFLFQGVLLYLIFEAVVVDNVEWQNGIMKLGTSGKDVTGLFSEKHTGCNDASSLCFQDQGNFSCAPPSIQLTGRWEELDTDADGIWTRKEVEAARDTLKCKYVVDPVEVFDVMIGMLKIREKLIWLHPDVVAGKAIHLPYFTYAMADLVMCGYRSKDMCGNLLKRGFFHAPLKYGTAPRVGTSIDSAMDYCNGLLEAGGHCENLLPSTYRVWKIQSEIECGSPSFSKFTYTNPGKTTVTKSLLEVDYSAPQEYMLAQDMGFRIFKGVMLASWLMLMVFDLKEIVKILTLCARYPDAADFGDNAVLVERDPADPEDVRYRIQGLSSSHRRNMVLLCILRFLVLCTLSLVGLSYLIKTNGYADLIMNGVTLLFVAEIAVMLYNQGLREEVRDQTSDIKPMKVPMYGIDWLNRMPAVVDMLWLAAIFVLVYAIMVWQFTNIVLPVEHALECTCTSSGEMCFEAQKFNYDFWHNYWLKGVPSVYADVERLKASAPAAGAALLTTHVQTVHEALEEQMERVESANAALMRRMETLEKEAPAEAPRMAAKVAALNPSKKVKTRVLSSTRHDVREHTF